MAKTLLLKGSPRSEIGRTALKIIRRAGRVPGVLYGKGKSQPVQFNAVELRRALQKSESENTLVSLELEKDGGTDSRMALVQDVQIDPITDAILHIDLHEVKQDEVLRAEVALHHQGEPIGVKSSGGLLETIMHSLEVECLPQDLPDHIVVDVSHLELDQSIHVRDIQVPPGVKILNHAELTVFTVKPPKTVEEEAAKPTVTEPEVIKEKKEVAPDKEKDEKKK
jgi:large subunit ribosomal protein L25